MLIWEGGGPGGKMGSKSGCVGTEGKMDSNYYADFSAK